MELKMNLSQNISLSPKMLQAMKILQMSAVELEEYIMAQALDNPVVELEEGKQAAGEPEHKRRKLEWLAESDEQNQVFYRQEAEAKENFYQDCEFFQDPGELLEDYLFSQLLTQQLTQKEYAVTKYMILSLDQKGYYSGDIKEAAGRFGITEKEAQTALKRVKSLEPAGVGACDLRECLLLQLRRQGREESTAAAIVADFLEQLGRNQLPAIAKALNISVAKVKKASDFIKTLNPKPGNSFSNREQLKYIIPDIVVLKSADNYQVCINEHKYSQITISSYYRNMLGETNEPEVKNYLQQKIRQAEWTCSCIAQRNVTLARVGQAILTWQDLFFVSGPTCQKPMKLDDIARQLQVHGSTVSRAIRGKYLQCSFGIFPLEYFFTGTSSTSKQGQTITPAQAKSRIKEMIETEDIKKPMSDRMISEKLLEHQVVLSRRTVAKYRETMGIPDASGRKSF